MLEHDEGTETPVVYATGNHDQFSYSTINRPLVENKVQRMMASISKNNWLRFYPITVREDGVVEDGQHRLEAARRLGVAIYYIISDMGIINVGLVALNTDKWRTEDFIHYYSQLAIQEEMEQYEDYVWLADFMRDNDHVTLASAIAVVRESRSAMYQIVREGKMEISEERRVLLQEVGDLALRLEPHLPALYSKATFQQALRTMLVHGKFKSDQLLDKFASTGMTVYRQAGVADYVRELSRIYNYGMSTNRVNFMEGRGYSP